MKFALALLLLIPMTASAQNLSEPLIKDPAVTIGKLPNGLTYYIRENRKPEKRAELRLAVNAGSVLEDEKQLGLAHFVEHMAFNGTRHFAKQQLVDYLESIGMRFGADLNAYTSFDETVYMLTVPTDTGRALEQGIQILEDWAHDQTFDPQEIDKERGVVIEEWRLGQGAQERMRDKYFPVLFSSSRYANRLPIGTRPSLEGFKHEDLVRFYRDWYRPELMAVIAVGDFDKTKVEQLIREHFSSWTVTGQAQRTLYPVPDHDSMKITIATDPEASVATVAVYHKLPADTARTVGDYKRMLTEQLFSSMLNDRLDELTQQADPPFINASAGQGSLIRTKEAFVLSAATKDDGITRGLESILTEAARVQRFGFTATELDRAKQNLLRAYERGYAERDKGESSDYASEYVNAFLEAEAIPGIATEYGLARQLIPQITLDSVNGLVKQWITDANRVVVVQAPEKPSVKVPTQQEFAAVFNKVKSAQLTAYEDKIGGAGLVPELPVRASVVTESRDTATGVVEWKLSNGVRVLLKSTDFQADQILMRAYSPGGSSLTTDKDYISAMASAPLVSLSGIGEFSAIELNKALAGKAVRVQPFIDDRFEGFAGQASPKDFETMLQLVYLNATSVRRDSAAYQSLISRFGALLENQNAVPEAAFRDTLEVILSQHHFRARPLTKEMLSEIDMERSLDIFRERFADASDFTFVFVGNFAPDSIKPLILKYIGGLPSTKRQETWRDTGIRPPTGVIAKDVLQGIEQKATTQLVFTGPLTWTPENRLALTLMLDIFEIRLRNAMREDLGATYGVDVSHSTSREPRPTYTIGVMFGSSPVRADTLAAVIFQQIDSLQKHGATADEIAKVKEAQRRGWEVNMKRNEYWLGQISGRDMANERIADMLILPERLDAITAEQIRQASLLLRPDNYVRVRLLPAQMQ